MDEEEKRPEREFRDDAEHIGIDDPCASINDPVRRTLCQVCQKPVIGEAPFCKDHEYPVP